MIFFLHFSSERQSPIFLVFLDCVFQICNQFPCSFEFNDKFLITIFEHAYSSQFGTFLGNNMKDRIDLGIISKTVSLWSYINLPENIVDYINPAYEANNSILWPSVAPQSIVSRCFVKFTLFHLGKDFHLTTITWLFIFVAGFMGIYVPSVDRGHEQPSEFQRNACSFKIQREATDEICRKVTKVSLNANLTRLDLK